MTGWRRGIALVVVATMWVLGGGVVASHEQGPRVPRFAIVDYQLVSVERIGRGVHEYTYRARLKNRGPAIAGATATLDRRHGDFEIVDGTLEFGPVGRNASAPSLDTFTFRHHGPKGLPGHGQYLRWDVQPIDGNRPPISDAGPDALQPVGQSVQLDGSRSSDPDGDALNYRWELRSKPVASRTELSGPDTVAPNFNVDAPGTYVAALVVNDGRAESAPDIVTVTTPNRTPVANAGPDSTMAIGDRAPLSGVGSSDPDGDPLTYRWRLSSRPAGSVAVLETATGVDSGLVPDVPGHYVVQLIVNDGRADSAPDEVVVGTANSAPVARAGADRSALVGDVVTLDGSGSSDVDGDALQFTWSVVSRPTGSVATPVDPSAVAPSVSIDKAGAYRLRLVVSDGVATSAPDEVEISTRNTAPVANAGVDAHVALGETVALDGSGSSDVDGDALTFAWSLATVPAGSAATIDVPASVTPHFTVDLPGTYVAQLIVNDGLASSTADTVVVTTRNSAPLARAGADQAAVAGQRVPLDGSASSDPEGTPLTFSWALVAVPTGSTTTLANPTSSAPWFIADRDGLYVVQLVVSDGELSSDPDTMSVSTTNTAPVAQAGPDQLDAPVDGVVALDGSGSSDADGHPLTYRWALIAVPTGSAATLSDDRAPAPTFTADRPGEYVAQLVVNDGLLDSAPDTVLIRTANRVPVASAGADQTVSVGASVTLDGTSSTDPDGGALAFDWQLVSAPTGSTAALSIPEPGKAGLVPDVAGRYTVRLTVTDAGGATATDDVDVDAAAPGTLVVPAQATFGQVQVGASASQDVTLTNSGGSPVGALTTTITGDFAVDPGAASTCLAGPVAPGTSCVLSVTFSPTAGGPREGTLTVDSDGTGGPQAVALSGDGVALPEVTIVAIDSAASEAGPDTATLRFQRSGETTGILAIRYTVTGTAANGGSDFTPFLSGDLTFNVGQAAVDVVLTPVSDGLVEGSEAVVVTLIDDVRYNLGPTMTATVTITDPPTPVVTVAVLDPDGSEAGPDPASVRFTRTGDSSTSLTVSYTRGGTATNGTDYVNIGGTISFSAGQATVDRIIMPINDGVVEGPETVSVTLVDGIDYDLGSGTTAGVTIADQPVPVVSIVAIDAMASEAGDTGTFRFIRTGDVTFSLSMTITRGGTATNSSDYSNISTTLAFPAGAATFDRVLTPINDSQVEGPETVILTLVDGANYDIVATPATVTIQDQPVPLVSVQAIAPNASEVGPTPGTFRFTRVGDLAFPLGVVFTRSGTATTGDFASIGTSVSIPPGQASVDVNVTPVTDALVEGTETVIVTVADRPNYDPVAPTVATVQISDN